MDNGENKNHGGNSGREGDRQVKEGAIRPVSNPKGPPPSKVEVSPASPSGDGSGSGGSGDSPAGDSGGGEE